MFEMFERFRNWIAPLKEPSEIKDAKEDIKKAYEDKKKARRQMLNAEYDLKQADFSILRAKAVLRLEEQLIEQDGEGEEKNV